jgi:hypothetical protein
MWVYVPLEGLRILHIVTANSRSSFLPDLNARKGLTGASGTDHQRHYSAFQFRTLDLSITTDSYRNLGDSEQLPFLQSIGETFDPDMRGVGLSGRRGPANRNVARLWGIV